MYRRRRPQREKIFFSFDSFLDVVANVVGIVLCEARAQRQRDHAADPLAIARAFSANLRTFATGVLVMRRVDQHEMGGGAAYFGTGHHQPEMGGLDMLPTGFQTVVHGRAETSLVASETVLDAAVHVCGYCHGLPHAALRRV